MRLKSLWIKDYKNLKDFSLDFEKGNGLSILIGNNGSGKSNVLEAISGIFHDLFLWKSKRKITCDYTLEYILDDGTYKLQRKNGILRCYRKSKQEQDEYEQVNRSEFIKNCTPNNVIGLYSGEEDRLWTQFYERYYKAYIQKIKSNQYQDHMRLILIDKRYWNIALLTLIVSENNTLKPFIKDELGINSIDKVDLYFDFSQYSRANELLKSFVDRINPDHVSYKSYKSDELSQEIYYDMIEDGEGNILDDGEGHIIVDDSGIIDPDVFRYLTQAYLPSKGKIIDKVDITFNQNLTVQHMSEGEKKLILVKTILEILSDEKTLVLMDEPDANIHEVRKSKLYKLFKEYPNRQIIMATHSPIIAKIASENELIYLDSKNGTASQISTGKLNLIKKLASDEWNIMEVGVVLTSEKPLIITEGKTDRKHLKKALSVFQSQSKYLDVDVNILEYSSDMGDSKLYDYLQNISKLPNATKIIGIFDSDEGHGKEISERTDGIEELGNNVFAMTISVPDFRKEIPNISIEFLYNDKDLKREDDNGRRLYTSDEFSKKGFLNSDKSIICQNAERLKNYEKTKIPKIVDDKVFNSDDQSKALSKNDFADNILSGVFSNVSFDGFLPTFDRLKIILSKETK